MHTPSESPPRADARRNRDAVLDAAVVLLGERPGASMQEVAEASGLGRTTVYRHFPTREALEEALLRRALDEFYGAAADAAAHPGTISEALHVLAELLIDLGDRYRFLEAHADLDAEDARREAAGTPRPLRERFKAEQDTGALRAGVPIQWMIDVVRALSTAAITAAARPDAEPAQVARLLGDTLAGAFAPPRPATPQA